MNAEELAILRVENAKLKEHNLSLLRRIKQLEKYSYRTYLHVESEYMKEFLKH